MTKVLSESTISECQAKFNLKYQVPLAYWCQQLVGFKGKDVLEVGGSLPQEFVFDYLNVKTWSALESPDYEVALEEIDGDYRGSNLYKINYYSNLGFKNRALGNYGNLNSQEWEALLPQLNGMILIERENQQAIANARAELMPTVPLASLGDMGNTQNPKNSSYCSKR